MVPPRFLGRESMDRPATVVTSSSPGEPGAEVLRLDAAYGAERVRGEFIEVEDACAPPRC